MGLKGFFKKFEKDEERDGWHSGEEDKDEIDVGGLLHAVKQVAKSKK